MPLTLDQIVEEVRRWPQERVTELVEQLMAAQQGAVSSVETAWKAETRRRVAEIESGAVQPVPGEEVSARIRRLVGR